MEIACKHSNVICFKILYSAQSVHMLQTQDAPRDLSPTGLQPAWHRPVGEANTFCPSPLQEGERRGKAFLLQED